MKINNSLFVLVLLNILCVVMSTTTTTLYVSPSSSFNQTGMCGDSIANACNTIFDAFNVFSHSDVVRDSDPKLTYPPLVIVLLPGTHSSQTYGNNSIPISGYNITIVSYNGQNSTFISGDHRTKEIFSLNTSNARGNALTSLTFANVTITNWSSLFVYINIEYPVNLNFINTTFTNNSANDNLVSVSAITSSKDRPIINLNNVSVYRNTGVFIYSFSSNITAVGLHVSNNTNLVPILSYSSNTKIINSIFQDNVARDIDSMIIRQNSDYLTIKSSVFRTNSMGCLIDGSNSANIQIISSLFLSNKATRSVGNIYLTASILNITGTFLNNNFAYNGGAIFAQNSKLFIRDSKLLDNFAVNGLALYQYQSNLVVKDSLFLYNAIVPHQINGSNFLYIYGGNTVLKDTQLKIQNTPVDLKSGFSMVSCNYADLTLHSTEMIYSNYNPITCESCSLNVNTAPFYGCSGDSSSYNSDSSFSSSDNSQSQSSQSSQSQSQSSQSSQSSYSPYYPLVPWEFKTILALLSFFCGVLLFALVLILSCCIRQRRNEKKLKDLESKQQQQCNETSPIINNAYPVIYYNNNINDDPPPYK